MRASAHSVLTGRAFRSAVHCLCSAQPKLPSFRASPRRDAPPLSPPPRSHACMKRQHNEVFRMSKCRSRCGEDRVHPVCGSGPAPHLQRPSPWPAKPERTAEQQSLARGQPLPGILGVRKRRKIRSRLWGRRTRIAIWCVRWGRSAGARCETRRRRASARACAARGAKAGREARRKAATLDTTA